MMMTWMIFGGTSEGRLLAEYCASEAIPVYVSVATDYGESLLPQSSPYLCLHNGRMDRQQMEQYFRENQIQSVIDATHPFATEVSQNIRAACEACALPYYRVVRQRSAEIPGAVYCDTMAEAVDFLESVPGRILVTTGSKELLELSRLTDAAERCTLRVLDTPAVREECHRLGFREEQILAGKGPFTQTQNEEHLRMSGASWLLTKESGSAGGFAQKAAAAARTGARLVVLRRPEEKGLSLEEAKEMLRNS